MTVWRLTRTWPDARKQQLAEWTATMMTAAESTARQLGVSPQAIVTQAALESAWGAAAIGHNIFGVKADASWTGARRLVWTREVLDGQSVMVEAWFRDYDSYEASIADHFAFLRANSRYAAAGVLNAASDIAYFEALARAGYATDPDYLQSLIAVFRSVHLFTRWMEPLDGTGVAATPPAAPRLLMIGTAGPDVAALQERLVIRADGVFGGITREHVIAFQLDHELEPDGIVGPATRRALGLQ